MGTEMEVLLHVEAKRLVQTCVEIKNRVAPTSLGDSILLSSADPTVCEFGDERFNQHVPKEHIAQVLHQLVVLHFPLSMYVAAAETRILYIVLAHCPGSLRATCLAELTNLTSPIVQWAYEGLNDFPDFIDAGQKELLRTRHNFWHVIDSYVKDKGASVPLKLFKHAAQSLYSRIKAGVDGSTQQRAILRSATSHFKLEQKLVSQTLKTLAVNAFIAWRMYERKELLESGDTFKSLDSYRNLLNKVQATADFMFDVSQELLSYADTLHGQQEERQKRVKIGTDEEQRLLSLARAGKRNRLGFFNSSDGVTVRLNVLGHALKQGRVMQYCGLCGQHREGWRGHRTSYSCSICAMPLCVRTYVGLRKSCFAIWHSAKELEMRRTSRPLQRVDGPGENEEPQVVAASIECEALNSRRRRQSGSSADEPAPQRRRRQ